MAFNPFDEKGLPLENQIRSWSQLNVEPYNKMEVDPYTRTRAILMNGRDRVSALFAPVGPPTVDSELRSGWRWCGASSNSRKRW